MSNPDPWTSRWNIFLVGFWQRLVCDEMGYLIRKKIFNGLCSPKQQMLDIY